MNINDYLIDPRELDWHSLFETWTWLLEGEFEVWLMNRFGDLFLIYDDGSVNMLDVGGGAIERLADSRDDFATKVDEDGNGSDWFMVPLVNQLVACGQTLEEGECYSFQQPPVLGGQYTIDNCRISALQKHYRVYGSIHEQIKDLPDGAEVEIEIED